VKRSLAVAPFMACLLLPIGAFAQQVGGGDLTFMPGKARPVLFSHEKHVSEHGLKCSGCHYQIFQMARGSYKMNMEMITKGDFCGKCHDGQKAFDVKDRKNCSRCHR
jgi:c(7)-type cytochrome triheme protein